jgi:hypothetical protein
MDGTRLIYDDEDHFLMFSARERVLNDVEAWMTKVTSARRAITESAPASAR